MTVPAAALSLAASPPPRASADELFELVSGEDFARWEAQLEATGNCANPVRLTGRIDAIDRATGEIATIYDTTNEPGGAAGCLVVGAPSSPTPGRRQLGPSRAAPPRRY